MRSQLKSEQELMSTWLGDKTQPLVSVSCTTYNHERFIEDCLQGLLIQVTNFPFEIIIHDDASTDNTQAIIQQYQQRYPSIIRTIFQTENQYSQGKKPGEFLFPAYKGKYIANCEGDDYWQDPNKLQIQAQFLEANPDYVVSCHDACIIDEHGNLLHKSKLPESRKRDFTQQELLYGRSWILTLSRMYRRMETRIPESRYIKNGDSFFAAVLGLQGKCKFHHEILPAAYRVHSNGIWSTVSDDTRTDDHINSWFWMYRYFNRIGEPKVAQFYLARSVMAATQKLSLWHAFKVFISRLVYFDTVKHAVGRVIGKQRARVIRDKLLDLISKRSKK